jgi:hypothetical protein
MRLPCPEGQGLEYERLSFFDSPGTWCSPGERGILMVRGTRKNGGGSCATARPAASILAPKPKGAFSLAMVVLGVLVMSIVTHLKENPK